MIKKRIGITLITISLLIFNSCATTKLTDESIKTLTNNTGMINDFFFYVPDENEMSDYITFYNSLINWENNKMKISDQDFDILYKDCVGKDSIDGLLFESFLRQTKNDDIKKQIIGIIENNKREDVFSQSIIRLYNSEKQVIKQNNTEQIRYSYKDKYYDENVNLFFMDKVSFFNNDLSKMLYYNPWAMLTFTSTGMKTINDNSDEDSFFLIYGGGTHSMKINFDRFSNIDLEYFKKKNVFNKFNFNQYDNWRIIELKKEGILNTTNADKIFIGAGNGPDVFEGIESGTFDIYLYNENLKTGYVISTYMNISTANNNYSERYRMWNTILMNLIFSYINIS